MDSTLQTEQAKAMLQHSTSILQIEKSKAMLHHVLLLSELNG
jgi:hypothetical protein